MMRNLSSLYIVSLWYWMINCSMAIKTRQSVTINDPCEGLTTEFVRNPYECESFYFCNEKGKAQLAFCPNGMTFNPATSICDLSENFICIPESNESTSTEIAEEIICPIDDDANLTFIESRTDCSKYYICYHGIPIEKNCIPELHWSKETQQCNFPHLVNCNLEMRTKCPKNGEAVSSHPINCNYFIYCIHGFVTVQQCPFYHNFDAVDKKCKLQTIARCSTKT